MKLATVTRIVRQYLPNAWIARRKLPGSGKLQGLTWRCRGEPIILYTFGLAPRERAFVIFHELAHQLYDVRDPRSTGHDRWREDRADRFAAEMMAMLEARVS